MKKEIWKDIPNFEDYQVSNYGRVKSLKYGKEKILKFKEDKGYLRVGLYNDENNNSKMLVHVLVAQVFLNKEKFKYMPYESKDEVDINKLEVNHIDGNKQNNHVNNLEWSTKSYNQKHSYIIGLKKSKIGYDNYRSKPIIQSDLNGKFVKEWANKREIERTLGYANSNINACCKHKRKTAYGYIWVYKEEYNVY